MTSKDRACCAHLHVSYLTSEVQGLTRGWWACDDCDVKFMPTPSHEYEIERLNNLVSVQQENLEELTRERDAAHALYEAAREQRDSQKSLLTVAPFIEERDRLRAALERLSAEFRAADLPYGSAAYREAQEALNGAATGLPRLEFGLEASDA